MIASFKSELRKIYTVRSTYLMLLFALVLMGFFAFWTEGIKAGVSSGALDDPNKLASLIYNAVINLVFFAAIVGILLFTHEYRYNTIMYTLTISNSRTKTLLAKLAAMSVFAVFFTVFVMVFASAMMYIGLAIKGYSLSPQTIPTDLWWKLFFTGWGTSMIAALIAIFIRQQVGAITAYFILPGIGEALLGLALKDNKIYLPFQALSQVTTTVSTQQAGEIELPVKFLTPGKAALVFSAYLVIGWIIAWLLFLRRDAN